MLIRFGPSATWSWATHEHDAREGAVEGDTVQMSSRELLSSNPGTGHANITTHDEGCRTFQ